MVGIRSKFVVAHQPPEGSTRIPKPPAKQRKGTQPAQHTRSAQATKSLNLGPQAATVPMPFDAVPDATQGRSGLGQTILQRGK